MRRKGGPGMKVAPLILSNPSSDFIGFSVSREPTNVKNQYRKRFQIQAQILSILEVILGSPGGHFESIFGVRWNYFREFFLNVFWTTPGATPDSQSGAPGVPATDRGLKGESNFGGLGPWGGLLDHDL